MASVVADAGTGCATAWGSAGPRSTGPRGGTGPVRGSAGSRSTGPRGGTGPVPGVRVAMAMSGQPPKNSPVTPPTIDWRRPPVFPSSTTRMPTLRAAAVSSPGSGIGDGSGSRDGVELRSSGTMGSVGPGPITNAGVGTGVGAGVGAAVFAAAGARVGFGVGLGVGRGVTRAGVRVGFGVGLGVGLAVGLGVGLGAVPHLSANRTVHIFLPVGPLYAPTPM